MSRILIHTEYSIGWLIPVLLTAALLSFLHYLKKEVPWSRPQNTFLFTIRTAALFMVFILILEPQLKRVTTRLEPPIIHLALDNSQSVAARGDTVALKNKISSLLADLAEGFETELFTLSGATSIEFDHTTTDLTGLLSQAHAERFEGYHAATVLLTDGSFNRGASPLYQDYVKPIFTIGLGDTIPPKDVGIGRTRFNRVTYSGNQTPIKVEINQRGYDGEKLTIRLVENKKPIAITTLYLESTLQEVDFLIKNEAAGLRRLRVEIDAKEGESTYENNAEEIFLNVIEASQKVLFVAPAPHPDIKALRATLEEVGSYTTSLYIPSIHPEAPLEPFDVVVFHGAFSAPINYVPKKNPGIWYILNNESDWTAVSDSLPLLEVSVKGRTPDRVTGSFNEEFSKFKISSPEIFQNYPPIQVPYADYTVSPLAEVLMYQRLGSLTTTQPLMVVAEKGLNKQALLMGQGLWKWKMQEAATKAGKTVHFDEFVSKVVQFLSVKNDKKQFRFEPRTATFRDTRPALFDIEVYNEIYERIYGSEIDISIGNETGESLAYRYVPTQGMSTFKAPNLPAGLYTYTAKVRIGQEQFEESGAFIILREAAEYLDLTANHRLLKNLSARTNGEYLHLSDADQIHSLLKARDFRPLMKSEEKDQLLASVWWWYVIIFLLFGGEWFLRRYWGGY